MQAAPPSATVLWMFTHPLLHKLLALLLVVSLLPGLPELLESVEHLLHDGHMPHSEQHESEQLAESHGTHADQEHGCTPMAHHCGCHISMAGILPGAAALQVQRLLELQPSLLSFEPRPQSRANAPPTRPPIV